MATNNNNKVLNVPPLRFPEFSGEWRYLPLNEYLYENKERNKTGFFNKTSVLSVSGDFGVINQIQLLGRSFAGKSVLDYHVVRHGNIIYTKSPLKDFPYGIVKMNEGADGIVSTLYAVYNVRINASGKFIESYFALPRRANKYFKPIVRIGAKHDMKISNTEAIANIVCFPQYVEQQKIAKFLALIGTRISTQNKIIEDLKKLKSAIYQELFSNLQGEEKSLSELAEITKGQQVNGNQLSENGKYYVMNGGIMPSGYYDDYNTEAGTISISEGGNSCGYVQYNKSKFWSGGHCYTLHIKPTARISTLFLFHFLKWKEEDIMALRIGSGLPNIQKKDLYKVRIIVPTFDKQQQLIALLSTLQMKIEYEEMYTINLDKQKLHLLLQMFI